MPKLNTKTICPLPWMHLSAHLDSTMRICCNTDGNGYVSDNNGNNIKLSEITSVNEFFNLNFYKNIRSKMMKGECPAECNKCYTVEANEGLSTRQSFLKHFQSNTKWLDSVKSTSTAGEITPKVQSLDFSQSNKCNLKCIMCSPDASFLIKSDYDKLGLSYSKEIVEGAHKNWDKNPAYDNLIPQILSDLEEILTTGGEPFLNNDHLYIVKLLIKLGAAKNISLTYHTNCTVQNPELFKLWNEFKSINLHFSIDAIGELDEYIRHGTKWSKVEETVKLLVKHPKTNCQVHTTVQVLNIFSLTELYTWMAKIEELNTLPYHIWMDNPTWLKINILPTRLKLFARVKLKQYINGLFQHEGESIHPHLVEKAQQVLSYLNRSISEPEDNLGREIFIKRIKEFENLRKNNPIEDIVPELKHLFKK